MKCQETQPCEARVGPNKLTPSLLGPDPTGSAEQGAPMHPACPSLPTTCSSPEVMSCGDSEPYTCQPLNRNAHPPLVSEPVLPHSSLTPHPTRQ